MAKIPYLNFSGLLNIGASDFIKQKNELEACKNCYEYKMGLMEKVPGYSKAATGQVVNDKNVNYLHYYHRPSTNLDYLIAASDSGTDTKLYYKNSNSWTAITNATYSTINSVNFSMVNYLDKTFVVGHNGTSFVSNATISATTLDFSDASFNSATTAPQGKYLIVYKDLLYVLNSYLSSLDYPNRVYYCDEPVAGATAWTATATRYLEINDQGDEITGAGISTNRLVIFQHRSMWQWDESSLVKIADIGCDSYKSIISINGVLYWFNRDGIWRWAGGQPQLISSKIQGYINAITQSALTSCIGAQYNFEYRLFIGDVTVEGVSYVNSWICFNVQKEKFYIRCTYNTCKSTSKFIESSLERTYFGDNDGYVYKLANKIDAIYSDNSQDIDSFFITNYLDLGDPSIKKETPTGLVFTKNAQGLKIMVDADGKSQFSDGHAQVVKKNIQDIELNNTGYRFRFKFAETSQVKSWQFEGIILQADFDSSNFDE